MFVDVFSLQISETAVRATPGPGCPHLLLRRIPASGPKIHAWFTHTHTYIQSSSSSHSSTMTSAKVPTRLIFESDCFFSALWAEPSASSKLSEALSPPPAKTKPISCLLPLPAPRRSSVTSWAAKRRSTFMPCRSSFLYAPPNPPARAPAFIPRPLPCPSAFKIPKLTPAMVSGGTPGFSSPLCSSSRPSLSSPPSRPSLSSRPSHPSRPSLSSRPSHPPRPSLSSAPAKRPAPPLAKPAKKPKLSSSAASSLPSRSSSPPPPKLPKCPPPPPNSPDLSLSKRPFSYTLGKFLTIPQWPKAPSAPREPAVSHSSQD